MQSVFIVEATRTPIGGFLGGLKTVSAPKLGAATIRQTVERSAIPLEAIEECLMGCVLPAGIGQAPARQAALFAGLPQAVRCTTVNKVCGSGMKTLMLAAQMIQCGDIQVAVAGGMENMSQAPYLLPKMREGYRLGNSKMIDSMVHDGLWDVYGDQHMGNCAELCSKEYQFSREDQDRYAALSYQRALESQKKGLFEQEIVPIEVKNKKGTITVAADEEPQKGNPDKFASLRPAFDPQGVVTAANASSLNDGASSLLLASEDAVKQYGLKPIAKLLGQASFAQAPEWFTTAPVGAVQALIKKTGTPLAEIDLFEINEAFSVVALACMKDLKIEQERVNIRGGAVALGHPIGASGARIVTTLVHSLRAEKKRLGVAAICIGGGEASAVLIEAVS